MKESITFTSNDFKIKGNVQYSEPNHPCIIMLHGFTANKDLEFWKKIAKDFVNSGYSVLRFNFRGCGDGERASEGSFKNTTLTSRIQDYESAIKYLKNSDIISPCSLGTFGHSLGGMVSICSNNRAVKSIITFGTPFQIPRYGEPKLPEKHGEYYELPSGKKFKKGFYEDMEKYDIREFINNVPPLLIIQGSCDEVVSITHAKNIYNHAEEPKRLEIIYNADHMFSGNDNLNKVVDLSVEWFDKYLKD